MPYLAVMPGKRKPKTVPVSSLEWYKRNAKLVYYYNGSAADARAAIEKGTLKPLINNDHL